MLALSVLLINLALIIYSISIWSEFKRKSLLTWHVIMFSIGFIFDALGTYLMYRIGGSKIGINFHDILGYLSLFLMLCNAIAAISIIYRRDRNLIKSFYKFGVFAWSIWIISYIVGVSVNM